VQLAWAPAGAPCCLCLGWAGLVFFCGTNKQALTGSDFIVLACCSVRIWSGGLENTHTVLLYCLQYCFAPVQ